MKEAEKRTQREEYEKHIHDTYGFPVYSSIVESLHKAESAIQTAAEVLSEGMWKAGKPGEITERRNGEDVGILHQLNAGSGDMFELSLLVKAHNAAVKKLHETYAWRTLGGCDLSITMTRDGIEIGDTQKPDYEAGIQKAGDMLSVYGFEMAMPDRIILEYDMTDGSCKRVLLDDEQYAVYMYPRHPFMEKVNQNECEMISIMGCTIEKPDRIILGYGDDPDMAGRQVIITGDKLEIVDSSVEFHAKSNPASTNVKEDREVEYHE